MARSVITPSQSNSEFAVPLTLTPVDAVEGMSVEKLRLKLLYIRNGGGVPCEVTLLAGTLETGAFTGPADGPLVFTVPAGEVSVVGEPESSRFHQGVGELHLDFDQGTGVTIGAITV